MTSTKQRFLQRLGLDIDRFNESTGELPELSWIECVSKTCH